MEPPFITFCPGDVTAYVGDDQINALIEYRLPLADDNIDKNVPVFIVEGESFFISLIIFDNISLLMYCIYFFCVLNYFSIFTEFRKHAHHSVSLMLFISRASSKHHVKYQ